MTEVASEAHVALRERAVFFRDRPTVPLWIRGEGARDAVLHALSSRLLLRDGQAQQSLLLAEDGRPLADVTVCADDEDYLLVVDGLSPAALEAHLRTVLADIPGVSIEPAAESHEIVSLHGPFAWELLAEVLGADMMALPYLNFFRVDQGVALRSGKTGEYGYELVVRREHAEALVGAITKAAPAWDAVEADEATLCLARFEGWFFDPRVVPPGATPLELQLQWRLSHRAFVGAAAIAARRQSAARDPETARKLVCLLTSELAENGAAVSFEGHVLGSVVHAARSPTTRLAFASAMIAASHAHGGLALELPGGVRARTVAPPLLDNRSLHVDPRRHGYRTRDEITFGPRTRHLPVTQRREGAP